MKILYVEDEEALLSLIAMEIEAELDCQVIEIPSGNKAIQWLKNNDCSDLKIIISDNKMPDGSGAILFQYVKQNLSHIPFILTTGSSEATEHLEFQDFATSNPCNSTMLKPFPLETLTSRLKELLNLPNQPASLPYLRISHSRFRKDEKPPCDIYLKLSTDKYVKIFNAQDEVSQDFLDKYTGKGVEYFYVLKSSFQDFAKYYDEQINTKLSKALSAEEKLDTQLQGFESIQDYIQNIGLDANVVKTMNIVTQSSIDVMKQNPDLFHLVESMMRKENYLSEHSIMISYVAGALALEMEWVTTSTLQKLACAALLHDISLGNSSLARLSHEKEEEWEKNLNPEDIEKIKKHPIVMAELIKKQEVLTQMSIRLFLIIMKKLMVVAIQEI